MTGPELMQPAAGTRVTVEQIRRARAVLDSNPEPLLVERIVATDFRERYQAEVAEYFRGSEILRAQDAHIIAAIEGRPAPRPSRILLAAVRQALNRPQC